MITAVDDALKQLLLHQIPLATNEYDISFEAPSRSWSAQLSRPTIDLFLIEIKENAAFLLNQPPPNIQDKGFIPIRRELARVDLYYLVSCWAPTTVQQHTLLSHILRAILQTPIFPEDLLPDPLKNQSRTIRLRLAQDDNLPQITDLWNSLENDLHPALRLAVTVAVEPPHSDGISSLQPAGLRIFNESTGEDPGQVEKSAHDSPNEPTFPLAFHLISGRLRSQKYTNAVFKLVLRESGQEFSPDQEGEFRITRLQEGEYHLDILVNGRLVKQQKLHVPSTFVEIEI
ncbi:MAG: DUF4255 domain-containing protein [Anaerolineaceae bacterium]|nr:DUF4255 domain-containing protein [Anaerolineaceae bacterium]